MKRKILTTLLALTLAVGCSTITVSANTTGFVDENTTPSWEWAKESIYWAHENGIVAGKEGNIFDAEGKITRAEAATMLVRWMGIEVDGYGDTCEVFSDVEDGQWYTKFVNAAYENGLISGKGEGQFDPEGYLTRAEAATLIVNACGWILDAPEPGYEFIDFCPTFQDVGDNWYTPYVNTAYAHNVVSGMEEGFFKPLQEITRAQLVVMLDGVKTQEEAAQNYYICTYDMNNNLIQEKGYEYGSDILCETLEYTYNESDQLIQLIDYDALGALENKIVYTYDEEGRILTETKTDSEEVCYEIIEYHYDVDWGDMQEWYLYPLNESENYMYVRSFYNDGRSEGYCMATMDGVVLGSGESEYVYDEDGNLIEWWNGAWGDLEVRERYTYEDNGDLLQDAKYLFSRMEDWTIYEYDDAGNVVKYVNYSYEE